MIPERCQNPSKIMKHVTRGASGGVSGAFKNNKKPKRARNSEFIDFLREPGDFG
jgi:hypothetical protein